jgi:hypothetical protein
MGSSEKISFLGLYIKDLVLCLLMRPKLSIEEIRKMALSRGGRCLSEEYVNAKTKLEWECSIGHRFYLPYNAVKSENRWCRRCLAKRRSKDGFARALKEMDSIAKSRGGRCLSKEYLGIQEKIEWQCQEGHKWKAQPASIKHANTWCPECRGTKRLSIKGMESIAKSRGGRCLSKEYINAHVKLHWECLEGHRWKSTPSSIKYSETWCPECSKGLSERLCRAHFEQTFGMPFPSSRPKWLKNDRGNQMELDGYCEYLKIGFEHQGEQHYSSNNPFTKSERELEQRVSDDSLKLELCKQEGVALVLIPELFTRLRFKDLQRYIYDACQELAIATPKGMLERKIDLTSAWSIGTRKRYKELQEIANSYGGKCLSSNYLGALHDLEWECKKGHRWKATPSAIKNSAAWCRECRFSLSAMQSFAESRGWKCLSSEYVNAKTNLEWECGKGHQWKATPNNITNHGRGCPICAGRNKTILDIQAIAKSHGGKCLSKEYINAKTKLEWECKEGHVWKDYLAQVMDRSTFCLACKSSIAVIHPEIAAEAHGWNPIKVSRGSNEKLYWKCNKGHIYKMSPKNRTRKSKNSHCSVCRLKKNSS